MYLLIELIFGTECKDGEGEVMRNVSPLPPGRLENGLIFVCVPHGPSLILFSPRVNVIGCTFSGLKYNNSN